MVSQIHATVDDEQAAEIKRVKDDLGWTWKEFMVNAAIVLEDSYDEQNGVSWNQVERNIEEAFNE